MEFRAVIKKASVNNCIISYEVKMEIVGDER
jgi:hypothetical protein